MCIGESYICKWRPPAFKSVTERSAQFERWRTRTVRRAGAQRAPKRNGRWDSKPQLGYAKRNYLDTADGRKTEEDAIMYLEAVRWEA